MPAGTLRGRSARLVAGLASAVFAGAVPLPAAAQQAADFFRQSCAACHTIGGGRLVGPDLKGVTGRKDRTWLEGFILDPKARIDAGDAYALQLQREAHGVIMPTVPGLTPALAKGLVEFIEQQSGAAAAAPAAAPADRPFTESDVAAGRRLFDGSTRLANGGPPCASCHALTGAGALGGGALGPDLTRVYERLGDRRAVGAWLSAPATATMQAVFRPHPLEPGEIASILAAVEDAAKRGRTAAEAPNPWFFLLGFAGMVAGLAVLGKVWGWRFTAVRRPMVHGQRRGEA